MALDGEYNPNNVFARILRGELPAAKVWEDERTLVIMDAFPMTRGHCLVIPKASARNLLDAPPDTVTHLMAVTQRVTRAVVQSLQCDGVRVMQFNGSAAGQTVFHLHFHVLPVREGEEPARHGGGQADHEELQQLARLIRAEWAEASHY